jgi:hypothetical protein
VLRPASARPVRRQPLRPRAGWFSPHLSGA